MSTIDEVKQKTDIIEVISPYTTLTKAGRTLRALCPFHSEKHPSFYVYPEQQSWHCFGACNTGGDVFSFIMKKEGVDFGEALRFLGQRAGVTITSRFEPDTGKDEKERVYQANQAAAQYFHNLLLNSQAGEKARNYIGSRGLLLNTIIDFQLGFSLNSWEALKHHLVERGYTEDELLQAGLIIQAEDKKTYDRFRNLLMFPIRDEKGRVTGFGARVLDNSLPKYINSPQTPVFDKSGSLYGINLAIPAIRQQNLAVIVEGYADVLMAHQNGFTNVIAAMGTSITEKQVNILKKLTRNVVLALDADAAGDEACLRCVDYENILNTEIKVLLLPQDKDPDEVIKEDTKMWQHLLDDAVPIVDHAFNLVTATLDLSTARDKSLTVDRLLPLIAEMKDSVRRAHYLQKLAHLVRVGERDLEALLRKAKANQGRYSLKPGKESESIVRSPRSLLFSSPREEYCLALLLQNLELKSSRDNLLPEYFENSENRAILLAWQQVNDLTTLKDKLDTVVWEHLDILVNKKLHADQIEQKFADCVLNLRKKYLQNLETKRVEIFALEAELSGSGADLTKLKEEGIEISAQLGEIFTQKARRGQQQRR